MRVFHGDVRSYSFGKKYDFIITNPPFFENDLASQMEEQNIAKHSYQLTLLQLIEVIDRQLAVGGSFGILLPFQRVEYFISACEEYNFHLQEKLSIRHTSGNDFTRAVLHFGRNKPHATCSVEMSINNITGGYTEQFADLLKEYYLYL